MTSASEEPSAEALALLDAAACGLAQTREDGTFLRVNRSYCNWVGYPAEELIGVRRFQDLLTMGGRIFHHTHWAPLLRMQGSISEVKLEIVHRDGSSIPVVINALRRDQGKRVVHEIAAFVARDRDKYERELIHSRKRLEELVAEATRLQADAKDRAAFAEQMIGIVSHDLRNPLSSIAMGTALLARGDLSAGQQQTLSRISRSTDRATHLIADLLDFTQARLGKGLSIVLKPIDLHETVGEAVDELGLVYPGRGLRHARSGAGPCLGDAHRLSQLVGNLVSNAVSYGSTHAPITVTSVVAPGSFTLTVHNEGPPIPEAMQRDIFQPMTRGTSTSAERRSVGLGLFIVAEIAKAHGGSATLTSSEQDGTTFRATFPRERSPQA